MDDASTQILQFLASREGNALGSPTYRELAERLGATSVSTAQHHVRKLLDAGLIERLPGRSRGLQLTAQGRALASPSTHSTSHSTSQKEGSAALVGAQLAPWMRKRTFQAGTVLWRTGDSGQQGLLIQIEKGLVQIWRDLPDGRAMPLFLFGPGCVFGFLPFVDGGEYPASAKTLEKTEALVLSRADLLAVLRDDPEVGLELLTQLGRRLRSAFATIERLSQPTTLSRVTDGLAALLPGGEEGPKVLKLPQKAKDFAASLGVRPEAFSRAITHLAQRGVLRRLGPRSYQILDFAALNVPE